MIVRIILQVSLTTPFSSSVCLPCPLSLAPGFLVPASPFIVGYPGSLYHQPACFSCRRLGSKTNTASALPSFMNFLLLISKDCLLLLDFSPTITEDHSNPLPPAHYPSCLDRTSTTCHNFSHKSFFLFLIQSAVESVFFDGLCSSRETTGHSSSCVWFTSNVVQCRFTWIIG